MFSPYVCSIQAVSILTSFVASLCFVTVMTLERFLAICHPIKHHLMKGNRRTVKFILVSWIASLTIGLSPATFYHHLTTYCVLLPPPQDDAMYATAAAIPREIHVCPAVGVTHGYGPVIFLCAIYFGLWTLLALFNGSMYAKIIGTLKRRQLNMSRCSSGDNEAQFRQVATMLVANGATFFACCAIQTINVVFIAMSYSNPKLYPMNDYQKQVFADFVNFSMGLNSFINPLIYAMTNARYRKAFCETLRPLCAPLRVAMTCFGQRGVSSEDVEISVIKWCEFMEEDILPVGLTSQIVSRLCGFWLFRWHSLISLPTRRGRPLKVIVTFCESYLKLQNLHEMTHFFSRYTCNQ